MTLAPDSLTRVSAEPVLRDALVIAALALSLVALIAVFVLALRTRALRKAAVVLQAGDRHTSLVGIVARQQVEVEALRAEVVGLNQAIERSRIELSDAIRHVSVVRYDAFGDMGGRLSFSAALLDDAGDGLVLTAIHGRSETRTYVKGVTGGDADMQLSPEEEQAVTYAMKGS